MSAPRVGGSSPWGKIQDCRELCDGVWSVSTAGHGGIKLSRKRFSQMPEACRTTGFSGGGWYEEDCDWAIPAMQFSDLRAALGLSQEQVAETLSRWAHDEVKQTFGL